MDEVPVAWGGHMRDERPWVAAVGVIIHHIICVCLAKGGRRAWAPLQCCQLGYDQQDHGYVRLGEAVLQDGFDHQKTPPAFRSAHPPVYFIGLC